MAEWGIKAGKGRGRPSAVSAKDWYHANQIRSNNVVIPLCTQHRVVIYGVFARTLILHVYVDLCSSLFPNEQRCHIAGGQ